MEDQTKVIELIERALQELRRILSDNARVMRDPGEIEFRLQSLEQARAAYWRGDLDAGRRHLRRALCGPGWGDADFDLESSDSP